MDCMRCREAVSARLDGEDGGVAMAAVDRHLASCGACRAFEGGAARAARAFRVVPAEAVPDLTASIVAAAPPMRRPAGAGVLQLGLVLVALGELVHAVPSFVGDPGAGGHLAREQASWELALAAGLLAVARRPARASGLVPVLAALTVGMLATSGVDAAGGRVLLDTEVDHLLAPVGLLLLWLLARLRRPVPVRWATT